MFYLTYIHRGGERWMTLEETKPVIPLSRADTSRSYYDQRRKLYRRMRVLSVRPSHHPVILASLRFRSVSYSSLHSG